MALGGGSYTWPDGYIELDFEASAGVNRNDPENVKEEKLENYLKRAAKREKAWLRIFGSGLLAGVVYLFAAHLGMEVPVVPALVTWLGLFFLFGGI